MLYLSRQSLVYGHKNAIHDKLTIVGHSKGGDIDISAAIELNDIIDMAIINSCKLLACGRPRPTRWSYRVIFFLFIILKLQGNR